LVGIRCIRRDDLDDQGDPLAVGEDLVFAAQFRPMS
jgi:hypothetical protein